MKNTNMIDDINQSTMAKDVEFYSSCMGLTKAEYSALQMAQDVVDKPILDIGVGAGRTTEALIEISEQYLGIDYSREMVSACRTKYPGVRFEYADARNLSHFSDNMFYLVVFSMNGLCMVNHEGRLQILREIFRVLQPGGVFLFSAYNKKNSRHRKLFQFPEFNFTFHPLKFIARMIRYTNATLIRGWNRYKHIRHEHHTDSYSIINDVCHNYSTFLYYTTKDQQLSQLHCVGFDKEIVALDLAGDVIQHDTDHDSITYLVRK
ncbi:MAG: methyltransferase domain-containing protein [Gammaproteobacteria bacterium]|nr:methyltransferase domain-containing protein [Gammaproteobacteria bacterium]